VSRIVGIGLDVVDLRRFARLLERHGPAALRRICRDGEVRIAEGPGRIAHVAGLFAAKEATMKALGLVEDPCDWRHIEVLRSPSGACDLALHGRVREAATRLGAESFALSLSHEGDYATAVVITTIHETTP